MDTIEFLPIEAAVEQPKADSRHTPRELPHELRMLDAEEVQSLAPIFFQYGQPLPDPSLSFVVGAIGEEGKIDAFLVIQYALHAEPLWIRPGSEGVFRGLVGAAENILASKIPAGSAVPVYCFTPAGKVSQMAASVGMQVEPWVVCSRMVEGVAAVSAAAATRAAVGEEENSNLEETEAPDEFRAKQAGKEKLRATRPDCKHSRHPVQ